MIQCLLFAACCLGPAAPAGPCANLGYPIFTEALRSHWVDKSTLSRVVVKDSSAAFEWSKVLEWTRLGSAGQLRVTLDHGVLDRRGYSHLTFALRCAQHGGQVAVQFSDAQGAPVGRRAYIAKYAEAPTASKWIRYDIPLKDLEVADSHVAGICLSDDAPGARPPCEVARIGLIDAPFEDRFSFYDASRWHKNGPWAVGGIFDCGFLQDHVAIDGGALDLRLDDQPSSGHRFSGGEIGSVAKYSYGLIEARMKPVHASGVISSLFTYTGPPAGTPWHEIDVEFLGDDTTIVSLGYYTDGKGYACGHAKLGFDAALGFHTYGIEWTPRRLRWYADGKLLDEETGARGPLPSIPGEIMANCWPTVNADGWAGKFSYAGKPLHARYEWIRYQPY